MAYSDNFNDNSIDGSLWSTSGSVTESGQTLNFTINSPFGDSYVQTTPTFNLLTTPVYIELTELTLTSGGAAYPLLLNESTFAYFMQFEISGGNISAHQNYGPVGLQGTQTYSPVTHRWLRIRVASTTVFYEYSSDGVNWNTLFSPTQPVDSTYTSAFTVIELTGFVGSTNTMSVDNFNTAPAATTTSTSSTSSSTSTSTSRSTSTSSTSASTSFSTSSTSHSTSTSASTSVSTSTTVSLTTSTSSTSSSSSTSSTSRSTSTSQSISTSTSTSSTSVSTSISTSSTSTSVSSSTSTTIMSWGFIPKTSICREVHRFKLRVDKLRTR